MKKKQSPLTSNTLLNYFLFFQPPKIWQSFPGGTSSTTAQAFAFATKTVSPFSLSNKKKLSLVAPPLTGPTYLPFYQASSSLSSWEAKLPNWTTGPLLQIENSTWEFLKTSFTEGDFFRLVMNPKNLVWDSFCHSHTDAWTKNTKVLVWSW